MPKIKKFKKIQDLEVHWTHNNTHTGLTKSDNKNMHQKKDEKHDEICATNQRLQAFFHSECLGEKRCRKKYKENKWLELVTNPS